MNPRVAEGAPPLSHVATAPKPASGSRVGQRDWTDTQEPVAAISDTRLGFHLAFQTIHGEPPYQIVRLIPEFPQVRPDIEEKTDIVWDLPQLCESIRRPGGYHVLNCSCGIGDHAGLRGLVFVAHPDDATIVWEIDIPDHHPALHDSFKEGQAVPDVTVGYRLSILPES